MLTCTHLLLHIVTLEPQKHEASKGKAGNGCSCTPVSLLSSCQVVLLNGIAVCLWTSFCYPQIQEHWTPPKIIDLINAATLHCLAIKMINNKPIHNFLVDPGMVKRVSSRPSIIENLSGMSLSPVVQVHKSHPQ